MIKRKLLITMTFLIGVLTFNANAQEYYETDMTSQFASLTLNSTWGGQYANTYYCPMVEVGGGLGMMNVVEKWSGSTVAPGTIMSATVTGLPTGTYKIELYGGAASTSLRDYMDSQLFSHTNNPVTGTAWVSGDSYTPEMALEYGDDINYPSSTGAELFAVSDGIEYCGQIPVYLATRFPDGAATITLDKIKVGNSGSVQIGIRITAPNTNWHFVQLKSVIAQLYDHLTDDVFHRWTAVVNGTISSDSPMLINNIGSEVEPGTTVYGNPNVECLEYADLSDYGRINISGDLGDDNSLRVILNCEEGNGSFVEITPTFFNGVATVYLNDLEYVHLNSIKAGGGTSNVNINSIDLMLKTSIEEARTKWQKAYDLATAALEAEAYKNVVGEERSNLQAEIDKEEPGSTDGYLQAGDLLLYATSIFKEAKSEYDALVISKDSLNVLLSSSIEILNVPSTDETYRESLKTEVETLFQSVDELRRAILLGKHSVKFWKIFLVPLIAISIYFFVSNFPAVEQTSDDEKISTPAAPTLPEINLPPQLKEKSSGEVEMKLFLNGELTGKEHMVYLSNMDGWKNWAQNDYGDFLFPENWHAKLRVENQSGKALINPRITVNVGYDEFYVDKPTLQDGQAFDLDIPLGGKMASPKKGSGNLQIILEAEGMPDIFLNKTFFLVE